MTEKMKCFLFGFFVGLTVFTTVFRSGAARRSPESNLEDYWSSVGGYLRKSMDEYGKSKSS